MYHPKAALATALGLLAADSERGIERLAAAAA
jgi:hypothetical protein